MIIQQAAPKDGEEIFSILQRCKDHLIDQDIYQWDDQYPDLHHIKSDINKGSLRKICINDKIAGIISFDEYQEPQYSSVKWSLSNAPVVIHRLAVDPMLQGMGVASRLVAFCEYRAADLKYKSIRLDVYSGNKSVVEFYMRRGYKEVGEVFFPKRKLPFLCMEKPVETFESCNPLVLQWD